MAWAKAPQFVADAGDVGALDSSFGAALQLLQRDGPEALAGAGPASALTLACRRLGWAARAPAQADTVLGHKN